MKTIQKNINLIKNLNKSYSEKEFFLIKDFIYETVTSIDDGLSKLKNKEQYKDELNESINKIMDIQVYLTNTRLDTFNIRVLNFIITTLDDLAQTLNRHCDERHILERRKFKLKG